MREEIRKVNLPKNENSFYDVFRKRDYKDNQKYKAVAGIRKVTFKKVK